MPGKEFYNDMHKSEIVVAGYLNEMGLDWYYQQPVFLYDENKRPRVWTPDFYLPALNLYLEVCGSDKFDYVYREEIYKRNDIPIVFLHLWKDKKDWRNWLKTSIVEIEETRHNRVMELVKKLVVK